MFAYLDSNCKYLCSLSAAHICTLINEMIINSKFGQLNLKSKGKIAMIAANLVFLPVRSHIMCLCIEKAFLTVKYATFDRKVHLIW